MRGVLRSVMVFAIFAAAFVATASWIGGLEPIGEVPTVREKWDYYLAHKDEYDTIFVGTSRTYRGIKPSVFDQLTAAAGIPTRTFNFGVDGMFPPEDDFITRRILENPPKNLKWVFMEISGFRDDFADRDPDSIRCAYWHDWTHASMVARSALWPKQRSVKWKKWFESEKGKATDAWVAWTHLRLFARKSLNMGMGSTVLSRMFLGQASRSANASTPQDGFVAMTAPGLIGKEKTRYEQEFAERQQKPARVVPMDPYHETCMAGTVERIRALGAEPVFYLAPTTGSMRAHPTESRGLPVFDFCDMAAYPELFVPEVRVDVAHLNMAGAELFTGHVAEKFIELARGQGSSRTPTPSTSR